MRGYRAAALLAVWSCAAPAAARAEGDNRPQDRFSFGGGFAMTSMGAETTAMTELGSAWPGFLLETSYWPNDYLAFGFDWQILGVGVPGAPPMAPPVVNTGVGVFAAVAVPLRYIQPYAGGGAGLRYNFVDHDSRGMNAVIYPLAGVNFYLSRNLRLFTQWHSLPLEDSGTARGQVLSAGARWSPDTFHRRRGVTKFTIVWGAAWATVALWAYVSLMASINADGGSNP